MKKTHLALALAVAAPVAFAAPSAEDMWNTIQQQQLEIERLKAQAAQTDAKVEATASAFESSNSGDWMSRTSIGGYGEHHFNHFEDKDDEVDAHRFVLFVGHHSLTLGQFLIPVGILNETHEPDTFYGTERNNVEAQIVPATWWETGAMVGGEILPGLSYNVAVHSGLKTPVTGSSTLLVRSGRQKSAKATAEDLAFTGRLKYTGIPTLALIRCSVWLIRRKC